MVLSEEVKSAPFSIFQVLLWVSVALLASDNGERVGIGLCEKTGRGQTTGAEESWRLGTGLRPAVKLTLATLMMVVRPLQKVEFKKANRS